MWFKPIILAISVILINTAHKIEIQTFQQKVKVKTDMVVWIYDELYFNAKEQSDILNSLDKQCEILKRQNIECHALDVSKCPDTKEHYNIQDSKTFYFKNGLDLEYQLHYDFEYLIDFIEMRNKNSYYEEIKTISRLERLQKDLDRETGMFGVLYIENRNDGNTSEIVRNYQKVSSYYMNQFEFYIVHDLQIMKTVGKQNRMVLYKGFDDKVVELDKLELYYMDRFIYLYSKPSLVRFNDVFMEYLLLEVHKPVVMLFLGSNEDVDSQNLKQIRNIRIQLRTNYQLAYANVNDKERMQELFSHLQMRFKATQCIIYQNNEDGSVDKYLMEEQISSMNILTFAENHRKRKDKLTKLVVNQQIEETLVDGVRVFNYLGFNSTLDDELKKSEAVVVFHHDHNQKLVDLYDEFVKSMDGWNRNGNGNGKLSFGRYNVDLNQNMQMFQDAPYIVYYWKDQDEKIEQKVVNIYNVYEAQLFDKVVDEQLVGFINSLYNKDDQEKYLSQVRINDYQMAPTHYFKRLEEERQEHIRMQQQRLKEEEEMKKQQEIEKEIRQQQQQQDNNDEEVVEKHEL